MNVTRVTEPGPGYLVELEQDDEVALYTRDPQPLLAGVPVLVPLTGLLVPLTGGRTAAELALLQWGVRRGGDMKLLAPNTAMSTPGGRVRYLLPDVPR